MIMQKVRRWCSCREVSLYNSRVPDTVMKSHAWHHKVGFALPVYGEDGNVERYNVFRGRLLIRHASSGKKYLYDILEIKKETGKSCQT